MTLWNASAVADLQQKALFILGRSRKPKQTWRSCVLWLSILIQSSGVVPLPAANVASLKTLWEKNIPPEWKRKVEVKYIYLVVVVRQVMQFCSVHGMSARDMLQMQYSGRKAASALLRISSARGFERVFPTRKLFFLISLVVFYKKKWYFPS